MTGRAALLTGLLGCGLLSAPASFAACPDEDLRPEPANTERVAGALICLHNQERKASGVAPLRVNGQLARAARAHSNDMVARRYFAYDTPDALDPFDRMRAAGYIRRGMFWNAGENIAWGSGARSIARSVFLAWMSSDAHRLALIASDFSEIGIGIAIGAPDAAHALLSNAVTYTVDFGWRAADVKEPRCKKTSPRRCRDRRR